jgi:hypothetical protein
MAQMDVTLSRAFKVYWSLLWRLVLFVAAPLVALGGLTFSPTAAMLIDAAGMTPDVLLSLSVGIGVPLALVVPVCIVRRVLRQAYADFRIVLEGEPRRLRIEPQLDPVAERPRRGVQARSVARRIDPSIGYEGGGRSAAPQVAARA